MLEAQVEVVVELGKTKITSRDLVNFKVGDIIQLDNDVSNELVIKVEGIPKFRGYPGTMKGSKAIQVSSIIARGGKKYG